MLAILVFACITLLLVFKAKDLFGQHIGNVDPLSVNAHDQESASARNTKKESTRPVYSEEYLNQISEAFPDFERQDFTKKAKIAFGIIFNAYARGDVEEIKDLVTTDVYKAFESAIAAKANDEEQLIASLNRVVFAEITDGCIVETQAHLTVKFTIEQHSSVSRNGHESNSSIVETCVHVWEFCRKPGSKTWLLCNIISTD